MRTLTVMYWSNSQQAWRSFKTFAGMESYFLNRGYVIVYR